MRALEDWWAAQGSPCHLHGLRMAALPPPWAAHGWAWCLHGLRMAALCGLVGCDAYGVGRDMCDWKMGPVKILYFEHM